MKYHNMCADVLTMLKVGFLLALGFITHGFVNVAAHAATMADADPIVLAVFNPDADGTIHANSIKAFSLSGSEPAATLHQPISTSPWKGLVFGGLTPVLDNVDQTTDSGAELSFDVENGAQGHAGIALWTNSTNGDLEVGLANIDITIDSQMPAQNLGLNIASSPLGVLDSYINQSFIPVTSGTMTMHPGDTIGYTVVISDAGHVLNGPQRTRIRMMAIISVVQKSVQPKVLSLLVTPVPPSATIIADRLTVTQGDSVNLTLTQSNNAPNGNGRKVSGPGLDLSDPSGSVVVTPPLGDSTYSYRVIGSVQLTWKSDDPNGTFLITGPNGTPVDVSSALSFNAYQSGAYTISQTDGGMTISDTKSITVPEVLPTVTVTATAPKPVINVFGGNVTISTPLVGISASPGSGAAPLATTISWTLNNASSFSVTKDGSFWASSGSNKQDSGLNVGSYTYQITAQPNAYSAVLSWTATNATSYSVSGPGSVSINANTATVTAPGLYTLTATGLGGTATATFTAPDSPGAAVASTTVVVSDAAPVIGSFSGSVSTTTPTASISASPSSGAAPLTTTVFWSIANASNFVVTKDGSAWASAGSSNTDSGLGAGSYTYQITAQPNGYSAILSWSASNATSFSVSGPGSVSINANTATVTAPGQYILIATGPGGTATAAFTAPNGPSAAVASTTVVVGNTPPSISTFNGTVGTVQPTVSITASPASGNAPLSSTIAWNVANASSFSVTKGGSSWASSGSSKLDPGLSAGTYSYQITALPQAYVGNLTWTSSFATTYSISGPSSAIIAGTSATVSAPGQYTLTATGPGGSTTASFTLPNGPTAASASASVSVSSAIAPSASITASPSTGIAPLLTSLIWSSANASSVSVTGPGVNSSSPSASLPLSMAAGTYNYTIVASGPGGTATATATVIVTDGTFALSTSAIGDGAVTAGGTYPRPNPTTTAITIIATPSSTSAFSGFSGDLVGTIVSNNADGTASLYVPMTQDRSILANFTSKLPQTIAFPNPGNKQLKDKDTYMGASATSGLPITYTIVSGPATLAGNHVTFTAEGTITIKASQPGNNMYLPASDVSVTFIITNPVTTKMKEVGPGAKINNGDSENTSFKPNIL